MSLEKNPTTGKVLELFGPTVEFLTSPQEAQSDFCVPRALFHQVSLFRFTLTPIQRIFSLSLVR